MHVVNVLSLLVDYDVPVYFLWTACSRSLASYFVEIRSRKGERGNVTIKFPAKLTKVSRQPLGHIHKVWVIDFWQVLDLHGKL